MKDVLSSAPSYVRSGHAEFTVSASSLASLSARFEIGKILDQYWIITDPEPKSNEAMISSFFDDLAADYGRVINAGQNAANVRHLLWLLLDYLRIPDGSLLDFGCGPGSSREQAQMRGRSVIGIDISPRMRALASKSGMAVLPPDEFTAPEGEKIAGGFASYVLHLDSRPESLRDVLATFGAGGALVANVHKDRGLETLCEYVDAEGFTWELLPRPTLDVHGSYLAITDA